MTAYIIQSARTPYFQNQPLILKLINHSVKGCRLCNETENPPYFCAMIVTYSFHWLFLGMLHAFYLSTCEINIKSDRTWDGIVRIFHDDLEDALHHRFGIRPNLDEEHLKTHVEDIQIYLNEHLFFTDNQEKAEYKIIKAVRHNDVLEILISGQSWFERPLTIRNNLLMELFDSQKNIMTIKATHEMTTLYFNKNSSSQQIEAL